MARGTVLALAMVTLVVALGAWWMMGVDAEPEPSSAAATAPPPRDRAAEVMDVPDLPAAAPAERTELTVPETDARADADDAPTAEAAPCGWLVGRVTRLVDGRPLAGVEIAASFTTDALDEERTRATTDDDGRFAFALLEDAELYWVEVPPTPRTTRWRAGEGLSVRVGAETVLDVEVPDGAILSGRVVDTEGRAVGDARVDGWTGTRWAIGRRLDRPDRTVTSDAAGHFTIDGLGPHFLLAATARDHAAHTRLHGTADVGAHVTDLVLVVSPARTLLGRVTDPGDLPVSGARIALTNRRHGASETVTSDDDVYRTGAVERSGTSEADGAFVVADLASCAYDVVVEHDEFPTWRGEHGPGDGELLVQLAAGGVVTGTVTDLGGRPVAEARLVYDTTDFGPEDRRRWTTTDEAGRFVFRGVAPTATGLVAVSAEGHAIQVVQPVVVTEEGPNTVPVVLEPAHPLAGRVVETNGEPVAGATVTISGDRVVDYGNVTMSPTPRWESHYFSLYETTTGTDGGFSFPRLYDGLFRIRATVPESEITALLDARSGADDLELVLDPDAIVGVTLFGRVTDGVTGRPVSDFFITPMIPSGEGGLAGTSHVFEDTDGEYRIRGLDPGEMQINASSRGYAPWSLPLRHFDLGGHPVDIALLPTRTVRLATVDEDGERLSGVALDFFDADGRSLMVESGPSSRSTGLKTDEQGEAIAAGLPADRITIRAKLGWFGSHKEFSVDLRYEPRGVVELMLGDVEETAILVFVVTGTPAQPLPRDAGTATLLQALEREMTSGRLRPLGGRAHVTAERTDGRVVSESVLDPDRPAEMVIPGADVAQPFVTRLAVPPAELTIEVEAEGFDRQTQSWRPDDGAGDEAVLLFVMTPS